MSLSNPLLKSVFIVAWLFLVGCSKSPEADDARGSDEAPVGGRETDPADGVAKGTPFSGDALSFAAGYRHDFGTIRESDGPVAHRFQIQNVSDRVLAFSLRSSSVCLTAEADAKQLGLGEKTAIDVTFDPTNRQGEFKSKSITLKFDDPGLKPQRLLLSARVLPRIEISPAAIEFGELDRGAASAPRRLTLTSSIENLEVKTASIAGRTPFALQKIGRDQATVEGKTQVQIVFRVSFSGSSRLGRHESFVKLETNDPQRPVITVPIRADVRGRLDVAPDRLHLRMGVPGERVEARVDLVPNSASAKFEVLNLEIDAPADMELVLKTVPHPGSDRGKRVVISGVVPEKLERGELGKLSIRTNVKGQEDLVIPLSGTVTPRSAATPGRKAPALRKSPFKFAESRHDFGKVREENGIVSHRFRFKNVTDQKVTIRKINASCSCIASRPEKTEYEPGESGEVAISFDPRARQGETGIKPVTIVTDHPSRPLASVFISAEVIPRIHMEPKAALFGDLPLGRASDEPLVVTLTTSLKEFKIESVTLPEDLPFEWKHVGTKEDSLGGETVRRLKFEIRFGGLDRVDRIRSFVRIKTNDPVRPEILYPVVVSVVGPLKVTPDKLFLRMREPGEIIDQVIRVRPRTPGTRFEVLGVEIDGRKDMKLRVSHSRNESDEVQIKLTGRAPETLGRPGRPLAKIFLRTDLKEQSLIEIPVRGSLRSQAKSR